MSTAQKRGSNLDNKLANEIHESTPSHVTAHSMRGSGNTRTPQPDVLVRIGGRDDIALEAKRASIDDGERTTFLDESSDDDISQLCACTNDYTRAYVALKLTRRELVVVKVGWTDDVSEATQSIVNRLPDCFDANYTRAGNVTIRKPSTDEWPSASAGDSDVEVICDTIEVECDVDD
jgi:hypothetical protein